MKKIKTFADACRILKIKPVLPDVSMLPLEHQKSVIAYYKLIIIARALNGKWVADFEDSTQWKYAPWFQFVPGVGFRCRACGGWDTHTHVGSRLCYKNEATAKYVAKQFEKLYNEWLSTGITA